MSIRRRLVIGLTLLGLIALIGLGSSLGVSLYTNHLLDRLGHHNLPQLEQSGRIEQQVRRLELETLDYLVEPGNAKRTTIVSQFKPLTEAVRTYQSQYEINTIGGGAVLQQQSDQLQQTVREVLDSEDAEQQVVEQFNIDARAANFLVDRQLTIIAGNDRLRLIDARLRLQTIQLSTYRYIATNDGSERSNALESAEILRGMTQSMAGAEGFSSAMFESFGKLADHTKTTLDAHDTSQRSTRRLRNSVATLSNTISDINTQVLADSNAVSTNIETVSYLNQYALPVLSILGLATGAMLGFWILRGVGHLLTIVVQSSEQVRHGTYEVVPRTERGEIGALMAAFDEMVDTLHARDRSLSIANGELSVALKRAEEASRLKSQFLATMSHELRTPMTGILGFVNMLQRGIYGPLNPDIHEALQSIETNGQHLLRLINDVLDIARIEAGRVQLQVASVDIAQITNQALQATRSMAEEKSLAVWATIDPELPLTVLGDEMRLRQVMINFLSNAVKFTEHGEVELKVRKLDDDHWQIQVRDTGIGISPENQALVWESFRQVDGSTSRFYTGSGLGLSIVRELVMLMGGNVELESHPGIGSTFSATLPFHEIHKALPPVEVAN